MVVRKGITMEIRKASIKDLTDAVELAVKEYQGEAFKCKALDGILKEDSLKSVLSELVGTLFQEEHAYVSYEEGKLVGYLCFLGPFHGLFGNIRGAFSPLGGSAFAGENRTKVSSMLLSYAMEQMVKKEILSISLSRYANDDEVGKALVFNGFGIRCTDSIKEISHIQEKEDVLEGINFCELQKEEFQQVLELEKGLCNHMRKAPIFMPLNLSKEFPDKMVSVGSRMFVAKENAGGKEKTIGYIRIGGEGETFISGLSTIKNICGAYVDVNYRNNKIAEGLLNYIIGVLQNEGVPYLGVDCETLNPTALRFWRKYFKNYTYSYTRRIDERVVGYEEYERMFWEE